MCQEFIEGLIFRYIKEIIFKFIGLFLRTKKNQHVVIEQKESIEQETMEHKATENEGTSEIVEGKSSAERTNLQKQSSGDEINDQTAESSENNQETDLRLRKVEKQVSKEENVSSETTQTNVNREKKNSRDAIHFHFTIFLLWFIVSLLSVPSVLTWARNFQ